jgi:hypothetical protein
MKYRHLFWGILLIAIGTLFILGNLGILTFSWYSLWRLWPMILVLWGISILPVKDLLKFILLVGVLLITFLVINRLPADRPWYWKFHQHNNDRFSYEWNDDEDSTSGNFKNQSFTVPFDTLAKRGTLALDAAAGNFRVEGLTNDFLDFSKTGEIGNYELTTGEIPGGKSIKLRLQEGNVHGSIEKNRVSIKLNAKPSWNLKLDIGAADIKLDLSEYKIDTTDIDAGASSIKIKLGDKVAKSILNLNAGASSIEVEVPRAAGCQVSSESFLISKEFEGLDKKSDNTYQTPNFSSSPNKIYITVKTAVSSIRIKRY